jgi:DnaJ-class molecular chaperone
MSCSCGTCGGTGFNFGGMRCSQCKGTGKSIKREFKVNTKSCGYCGGTGFLYGGMNCPKCKGNKA